MCELVRSAAAHAIEEKMSDYLQPNGQYLLLDSAGQVAGRMDGYGVYFASDTGMQSRAIAKRGEHCYRVIGFSVGTTIGRISGDRMLLLGLPPLRLKLIGRRTVERSNPSRTKLCADSWASLLNRACACLAAHHCRKPCPASCD